MCARRNRRNSKAEMRRITHINCQLKPGYAMSGKFESMLKHEAVPPPPRNWRQTQVDHFPGFATGVMVQREKGGTVLPCPVLVLGSALRSCPHVVLSSAQATDHRSAAASAVASSLILQPACQAASRAFCLRLRTVSSFRSRSAKIV